jgi:hypothetical protein
VVRRRIQIGVGASFHKVHTLRAISGHVVCVACCLSHEIKAYEWKSLFCILHHGVIFDTR